MKILHVITGLDGGGAERQLANLVRGSDPALSHVVVSLMDEGVYGADIRSAGGEMHWLDLPRGQATPAALWRLARLIRRHRPDVVQTWLYHADLAGLIAARMSGRVPVIWTLRCSNMRLEHYSPLTRRVIRLLGWLSRMPNAVVANSAAGMKVHQSMGYRPRQELIIPNGIDVAIFRPDASARARLRAEWSVADTHPLIGCIARHDPMKDHAGLFRAFAQLPGTPRLLLAGKGTEPGNVTIAAEMAAAGVRPERVICLGDRRDIPAILASIDICVLGSAFGEGFPNVVAEAMACGIPCAATDVGDTSRIIGPVGELAAPGDPASLAAAMTRLLSLPAEVRQQLGARSRERIESEFPLAAMVRAYADLYNRVRN